MAKKQVPVIGGVRKVINIPNPTENTATTIAGLSGQTISIAQLRALLGLGTPPSPSVGGAGGGTPGVLVLGPGLSGGGPLTGAVPLNLIAPIPAFVFDDGGGGGDGDVGPPGLPGASVTGAQGPAGPAVFFLPDDPEAALDAIPGSVGPTGATGAAGPMGPAIFMVGDDGGDGDPGPPGPQGPAGASGSITTPVPATIPDLLWWLRGDIVMGTNGVGIPTLSNQTPWATGPFVSNTGSGVSVGSSQLNSLNVLAWPGSSSGRYPISIPLTFHKVTVFIVFNPASASNQTLFSGVTGAFEVDINSGTGNFNITKTFTTVIGATTATLTAGTWYQANVSYDDSSGAYAFRVSQAAAGSGTNAQGISATTNGMGYNVAAGGNDLSSMIAEVIVYGRVLSGTEKSTVEAYLHTKWGV